MGRPSSYTRELADRICDELAHGKTLTAICKQEGMPTHMTVLNWRSADRDGFRARYDEARMTGYQVWADEICDLADGSGSTPGEVQKARLQFDARRWLLSKALPKIYGERMSVAGDPEAPLGVVLMPAKSE